MMFCSMHGLFCFNIEFHSVLILCIGCRALERRVGVGGLTTQDGNGLCFNKAYFVCTVGRSAGGVEADILLVTNQLFASCSC
jgi:hypothetical protein